MYAIDWIMIILAKIHFVVISEETDNVFNQHINRLSS